MKYVIIVGASFTGLNLTKKRNNNSSYNVTLINRLQLSPNSTPGFPSSYLDLKSSMSGAVVPINKLSAPVLKSGWFNI
jgi:hypothetical protein